MPQNINPQQDYIAGYNPPEIPDVSAGAYAKEHGIGRIPYGVFSLLSPSARVRLFHNGQFNDWATNRLNEYNRALDVYNTEWNTPANQLKLQQDAGYNSFFSSGSNFASNVGTASAPSPLGYNQGASAIDIAQTFGGALSKVFGLINGIQQLNVVNSQLEGQRLSNEGQRLNNTYKSIINSRGLMYNDSYQDYLNLRNAGMHNVNLLRESNLGLNKLRGRIYGQDYISRANANLMTNYLLGRASLPASSLYGQRVNAELRSLGLSNETRRLQNQGLGFYNGANYLGLVKSSLQLDNAIKGLSYRQQQFAMPLVEKQIENGIARAAADKLDIQKFKKQLELDLKSQKWTHSMNTYVKPIVSTAADIVGAASSIMFGTSAIHKAFAPQMPPLVKQWQHRMPTPDGGYYDEFGYGY